MTTAAPHRSRRAVNSALWVRQDALLALVLLIAGVVLWSVGWYRAAGEVSFNEQRGPLNLAVLGTILGSAGFVLWFLRGRRAIGFRRRVLAERRRALVHPASTAPRVAASLAPRSVSPVLVAGPVLARYHRADCPLAAGRGWASGLRGEHEAAGRHACGVCLP